MEKQTLFKDLGNRVLAKDIYVSNNSRITMQNNNDLIIGCSGSGKTTGYVIPNLLNANHSMVLTDTKGDLYSRYADALRARGFEVRCINIVNPEKSYGYNPIDYIQRYDDGGYREQDVMTIATTLMPSLDRSEPFWEKAATSYLIFLIEFMLETIDPKKHNLVTVAKMHSSYCANNGMILFEKYAHNKPDTPASQKFKTMQSSLKADKMWGSILEFGTQALFPYGLKEMKGVLGAEENFDIASLGNSKQVLFLNVSDTDRSFDQLVNLIYAQILHVLCLEASKNPDNRLKVPVRLILDDFATNTVIPDFDNLISVIRSREIYVTPVLQDINQLFSRYDNSRALTIVNNCDHLIYLGGQDNNTAEFIAKRGAIYFKDILWMAQDKCYILTNGQRPVMADKIRPTEMESIDANLKQEEEFADEIEF